jgi:type I restriction enzyme S subunit
MNIKLGDLCKIQAGGTPSRNISKYWENGDIPWVKIGDIESKFLNKTTEFITKEGLNNSSAKMIEKGSILYTIFATLGEVCITNIDVTTNQAIAGLTLRDDKVDLEYLYYFLKSLHLHVNSIGRGVAQNNINLTILREFSVPVPNRKKQLEIANILKVIENIIESRKKQIQEYDQLIKSRFVGVSLMKNRVKIPKLLFFQEGPGVRNYQYTTEGVKLLNVANLVNGNLDLSTSERYISEEEAYGKYKHFLCDEGDLIIASSGIKVDYFDKKMGFVKPEHLPLCMNTSTIRFKSLDREVLDINYFMYFLKSQAFKKQLARQITGSAQLNFGPSHLSKMSFSLIDMEDQINIVKQLGKIELIIEMKTKQIQEYDQLIKSRFVEMFGDTKTNSKKLPLVKPEEICESISAGGDRPDEVSSIKTTDFAYPIFSNGEKDDGLYGWSKEYRIEKPSVTVSGRGTIGYSSYRKDGKFTPIVRLIVMTPNEKVNPVYLTYYLNLEREEGSGSGVQQLTVPMIKSKKIMLPELIKQNKFAEFVEQVDKLKFEVQKSLDESQTLFDSLMQEYFG